MLGVEYILKKARQLNRPVVICLGVGTNFGSHDGFSIFEEYLSGVSNQRSVCLCVAAGNESQERHHMSGKIWISKLAQMQVIFVSPSGIPQPTVSPFPCDLIKSEPISFEDVPAVLLFNIQTSVGDMVH